MASQTAKAATDLATSLKSNENIITVPGIVPRLNEV